ncbi:hypothetical protein CEXT_66561 [Caerostris extrusa]|uniref:Uncharacterized protein n=1 Tax=Caerostris extrusa TaxID=172846 RepID=A0AAV4XRS2_CAEEX|nr:hypothetical protein CEXT_66561 [Caerostris extrusa]
MRLMSVYQSPPTSPKKALNEISGCNGMCPEAFYRFFLPATVCVYRGLCSCVLWRFTLLAASAFAMKKTHPVNKETPLVYVCFYRFPRNKSF